MLIVTHSYHNYRLTRKECNIRRMERLWMDSHSLRFCILHKFQKNYRAIILNFREDYSLCCKLPIFFEIFHENVDWLELKFYAEENTTLASDPNTVSQRFISQNRSYWSRTSNPVYQDFVNANVSFDQFLSLHKCQDKPLPQIKTLSVNMHDIGRCNKLISLLNNNKLIKLLNLTNSVKDLTCLFLKSNDLNNMQQFIPCINLLFEKLENLSSVSVTIHLNCGVSILEIKLYYYRTLILDLLINCVCHSSNIKTLTVCCGYAGAMEWDTNNVAVTVDDKKKLLKKNQDKLKSELLQSVKKSYKYFEKLWNDKEKQELICQKSLAFKQIFTFDFGFVLR